MPTDTRKITGERGEEEAARYLTRSGFSILERNVRTRAGEIDLVAKEGKTLVFVEVKTRSSAAAGEPVEAVTFHKQRQLTRLALAWLKRRGLLEHRARFDIVAIVWPEGSRVPQITHYRNAFEPAGVDGMFS